MQNRRTAKIRQVAWVIVNNHLDVDDLCSMLEISPEDLLERFEDRMYEHQDKFLLEEEYDQIDEEVKDEEEEGIENVYTERD